jgi:hypothetical protein
MLKFRVLLEEQGDSHVPNDILIDLMCDLHHHYKSADNATPVYRAFGMDLRCSYKASLAKERELHRQIRT